MKKSFAVLCLSVALSAVAFATPSGESKAAKPAADGLITVKGEVVDMACYLDHGATGAEHADCAKTCILSGLPVGIKAADGGKTYLVIGEHKAFNQQLAEYAGKTVTLRGKAAGRDGINLLENAEIVK